MKFIKILKETIINTIQIYLIFLIIKSNNYSILKEKDLLIPRIEDWIEYIQIKLELLNYLT